jgi:hypothetical protein
VNLTFFSNTIANTHTHALPERGTHTNRLAACRVPYSVSPVHDEEYPRRFFPVSLFCASSIPSTTTPSSPSPPSPPTLTHALVHPPTHTQRCPSSSHREKGERRRRLIPLPHHRKSPLRRNLFSGRRTGIFVVAVVVERYHRHHLFLSPPTARVSFLSSLLSLFLSLPSSPVSALISWSPPPPPPYPQLISPPPPAPNWGGGCG